MKIKSNQVNTFDVATIPMNTEDKTNEKTPNEITLDINDDLYVGSLAEDVVDQFTCLFCYGIVISPIKCLHCETLVCKKCVAHLTIKGFRSYF